MIPTAPPGNLIRRRSDLLGLYIHFPYCVHKCDYCDFFSVGTGEKTVSDTLLRQFEAGVLREFQIRVPQFRRFEKVNTVYFGGGTSSLMPPELIRRFLDIFRSEFRLTDDCEITLEGNPESMDADYLMSLTQVGITRVNTGIQTFDPGLLDSVHRLYDTDRYSRILSDLKNCGIEDRGVDLIYGFADQRFDDFQRDLDRVLEAGLSHLSIYSLTVEPGTPYARSIREGAARAPNEELAADIFEHLPDLLERRGYGQYEISNYARRGRECRHNLRYWLCEPCLAVGPGAHGTDGRSRYGNLRNIAAWAADPAGARGTKVDAASEISLSLLRVTLPFDPLLVTDIFAENHPDEVRSNGFDVTVRSIFQKWVDAGLGEWTSAGDADGSTVAASDADDSGGRTRKFFHWTRDGLRFLDERIVEMSTALETIRAGSDGR